MQNLRMRGLLSAALICFLVLTLGTALRASAQRQTADGEKNKPQNGAQTTEDDNEVVRVDTTMVVNGVEVFDRKGRFVKGLKKKDFVVTENGEAQRIDSFALGDDKNVPRSIVLIIDYSGSQRFYIDTSVEAAKTLIDGLNPRDKIAVLTDDVKMLSGFTTDKELLKKRLDTLKILSGEKRYGASLQYTALLSALKNLFGADDARPIVIFQTDGDELSWVQRKTFTLSDVLRAVEKSRATIYSIIPGQKFVGAGRKEQERLADIEIQKSAGGFNAQSQISYAPAAQSEQYQELLKTYAKRTLGEQTALTQVADASGGFADYIRTPSDAGAVYARILQRINELYLVGYYPSNEARDNRQRIVKVEVRGHPEYQVSGLKIYVNAEK